MNEIPVEFYNLKKAGVKHHPQANNVGELIKHLQRLPTNLPIDLGNDGVELIVYNFNCGNNRAYLYLSDIYLNLEE